MEIGEELYILRKKIYGSDIRIYQKGIVIGLYPTFFRVKFNCKNGNDYKESFNNITTRYKKELNENDRLY